MPYIGNLEANAAAYAEERDLLLAGLSYTEIGNQTGERIRTISERNRLIHKVDIWDAFACRIEREGVPRRVPNDKILCAWFVGLIDGEGSFILFMRQCTRRSQYTEFRLGLRVQLRDDDACVLETIRDGLGVGRLAKHKPNGSTRGSVSWSCEKIQDLAETLVPIFDEISLRSKKAREFAIWRPLVMRRYVDTMAGYSNRNGVKKEYAELFKAAIKNIRHIRHGPAA